ncbi:hypothetical protein LCGC14_1841680 [marine sediment metagenome]|uniref:Uncharacterized protein n=1 Tax=marine sediment metagenome TaxID=412755 RepID=A0A0F9H171_9ZZZZ
MLPPLLMCAWRCAAAVGKTPWLAVVTLVETVFAALTGGEHPYAFERLQHEFEAARHCVWLL